jgi:hypothetical protein
MLCVPTYLAPSAIEGFGPFAAEPVPAAFHRRAVAAAGYHIGGAAEGAVRRGRRPRPLQLLGARVGTVAGFAALGAATAALVINNTEGNGPGDDERLLATTTLVGAGVGVVVKRLQARGLPPRSVASRLHAGRGPGGRLDITLRSPRG